jgi:transcriptional regulator with XRE-family HTH domain
MKLEELLKQYRHENKLSQRELARRCGLSNSSISLFEMGKNPQTGKVMALDMETYKKLADGMGIPVHNLFEKLGNDATVNILPVKGSRPSFVKLTVDAVNKPVLNDFESGDNYAPPIKAAMNPQLHELEKLWGTATPKAKKAAVSAALEVLRVMSDADE